MKKFITRDAVVFPIDVDFEREYIDEETSKPHKKQVKRSLFSRMNPFPQKKIMTFNKHVQNFGFDVHLSDLEHLGEHEIEYVGNQKLSHVEVEGVAEALEKNLKEENVESKGIKAHFNLNDSGLLKLTSIEAVFEKNITVEQQEKEEKEKLEAEKLAKPDGKETEGTTDKDGTSKEGDDAWAKLGDTISSFFGGKHFYTFLTEKHG